MLCLMLLLYAWFALGLTRAIGIAVIYSNRDDSIVIEITRGSSCFARWRNYIESRNSTMWIFFFNFAFKIVRFYVTRCALELIRCVYHVQRWFTIQHLYHGIGEKKAKNDTINAFECELRTRAPWIRIITCNCTGVGLACLTSDLRDEWT